jgi:hypothetical protein
VAWTCSINLYFPASKVADALEAVTRIADLSSMAPCALSLPGGLSVTLPYGRSRDNGPSKRTIGTEPTKIEFVLKVPADETVDRLSEEELCEEDGSLYARIDLNGLWISVGQKYAELSFHGLTGPASTILWQSAAVHGRLLSVLEQAGGLAGAVISDDGAVRLLSSPPVDLRIDWDWVSQGGDPDPEKLAEEIVRQSAGAQP